MIDVIIEYGCYFVPVICVLLMMLIYYLCFYFIYKKKIYVYPAQGWLDINEHYLPDDIERFLATDGKDVSEKYSFECDRRGKVYYSKYSQTYITHWQPLPLPPKKGT